MSLSREAAGTENWPPAAANEVPTAASSQQQLSNFHFNARDRLLRAIGIGNLIDGKFVEMGDGRRREKPIVQFIFSYTAICDFFNLIRNRGSKFDH